MAAAKDNIVDPTTPLVTEEMINTFREDGSDAWVTIKGKEFRASDLLRVLARRVKAVESERDFWLHYPASGMED